MHRIALAVLLTVALAGCASVRKGLGEYQRAADKGINVGSSAVEGGGDVASTDVGGRGSNPSGGGSGNKGRPELPGGLGGDKANASYTSPPQ